MDCLYLKKLKKEKGYKDSKKLIKHTLHTAWGDLEFVDMGDFMAEPHEENVRIEPQEAEEIHINEGVLAQLERMRELERAMEPVRYEPVRI